MEKFKASRTVDIVGDQVLRVQQGKMGKANLVLVTDMESGKTEIEYVCQTAKIAQDRFLLTLGQLLVDWGFEPLRGSSHIQIANSLIKKAQLMAKQKTKWPLVAGAALQD